MNTRLTRVLVASLALMWPGFAAAQGKDVTLTYLEGQEVTTLCRLRARRLAGVFDPAAQDACRRCVAKALGRTR